MDWTMLNNSTSTLQRVKGLCYLLFLRYELNPYDAGRKLYLECQSNKLCIKIIDELKIELSSGVENLGMGKLIDDSEARKYLKKVVSAYEENE